MVLAKHIVQVALPEMAVVDFGGNGDWTLSSAGIRNW